MVEWLLANFKVDFNEKDYQGKTYMKFSNFGDLIQPRLGFTWDVKKDGTMKLAGCRRPSNSRVRKSRRR